ncbi:hypothetical protein D3C87_903950 [compost metagenome]
MHQANAHGGQERPPLPDKVQILHSLTQRLGNLFRRIRRAVLQQDAELITTQSRQRIALAQSGLQQRTNVPQQLIAGGMAAGVVNQFELIKIEEHQRMPPGMAREIVQRLLQAIFELATVSQPGQRVMGGLPRQIGDVLPFLGHIVQDQHRATDLSGITDRRADQGHRQCRAIEALDQLRVLAAATKLAAENVLDQGQPFGLGVVVEQIEQCRQRQTRRLFGFPVGHGFSGRVHVIDSAADVGGNDAITDRMQGNVRPILLQLQRLGKGMALFEQLVRTPQGQHDQPQRRGEIGQQQQPQDHPRAFAQGIAEGFRSRSHAIVDGENPCLPVLDISAAGTVLRNAAVHLLRHVIQLDQVGVTDRPAVNCGFQITEMAEVEVQPDQAGNVVRVVTTL